MSSRECFYVEGCKILAREPALPEMGRLGVGPILTAVLVCLPVVAGMGMSGLRELVMAGTFSIFMRRRLDCDFFIWRSVD